MIKNEYLLNTIKNSYLYYFIFNSIFLEITSKVLIFNFSMIYLIEILFFIFLFNTKIKIHRFIIALISYSLILNVYWGGSFIELVYGFVLILPCYNIYVSASNFDKRKFNLVALYGLFFLTGRLFTTDIIAEDLDYRLRLKLMLFAYVFFYGKRILAFILFFLSGFWAFIIPLISSYFPKKYLIYNLIFVAGVFVVSESYMNRNEISSRLYWNENRLELISNNPIFGYGIISTSHPINKKYRFDSIDSSRFNQKLEVIDFGYVDLFLKFGIPIGLLLLFFIYNKFRDIFTFPVLISLLIVNVTFALFSTSLAISQLILIYSYHDRHKQILRTI